MKDRLPALDGLRGLAALGVVLAHINFQPQLISSAPTLIESYRSLAVGPNSVQILFVLCGFLMALLYPIIPNKLAFIQKRYTRIFPVFGVIVTYLWLTSLENIVPVTVQPVLLSIIALVFFGGWKLLRKIDSTGQLGRYVFYSFLALQIIMVGLSLTILPKIILFQTINVPPLVQNILIALSNITLTTPLVLGLKRLSLVFWSLAPEVLFYLLYPVIVIPLIKIGRKIGILGSIIMIGVITKILFDLELATISIGALQSMSIARASGFVAGVTIGSIYQSRGTIWQKIEGVGSKKFISILIILSFIFIQWGDGAVRNGQSTQFMNLYYLLSSWIFAAVIAVAIIPNTIVYKILKNKFFIFLGVISYSMYLIHTEVVGWIDQVFLHFTIYRDGQVIPSSIHLFLSLGATFIVSFILFHIVEKRYFDGKKNSIKSKKAILSNSSSSNKITYSFVAFLLLLSITIYTGAYPLSFSLSRQSFPTNIHKNASLLDGPVSKQKNIHRPQAKRWCVSSFRCRTM
jgi:peptidoglycan/LPS O-acetylase OafA/YrhL